MRITKLAPTLLAGILLVAGVACGTGQNAAPTPTPTPTETFTFTPTDIPTPTPTPSSTDTLTPTQTSGPCNWTGIWDTNWDTMELFQEGNQVTGTYQHDSGRIAATVSGNNLTGTWSEAPSYNPPDDAGDVELTISADCNSLWGQWRYGSTGGWSGDWTGTRLNSSNPTP